MARARNRRHGRNRRNRRNRTRYLTPSGEVLIFMIFISIVIVSSYVLK